MWLPPTWTRGKLLPWPGNEDRRLQPSAMSSSRWVREGQWKVVTFVVTSRHSTLGRFGTRSHSIKEHEHWLYSGWDVSWDIPIPSWNYAADLPPCSLLWGHAAKCGRYPGALATDCSWPGLVALTALMVTENQSKITNNWANWILSILHYYNK